jgi:hypothetical protein
MLVAVERDPLAMRFEILPRRLEVVEGRFRLDELQVHQAAGGVVDINEQGGLRAAVLEPPVLGAVDLHQLTETIASRPRLVNALQPVFPAKLRRYRLFRPCRSKAVVAATDVRRILSLIALLRRRPPQHEAAEVGRHRRQRRACILDAPTAARFRVPPAINLSVRTPARNRTRFAVAKAVRSAILNLE